MNKKMAIVLFSFLIANTGFANGYDEDRGPIYKDRFYKLGFYLNNEDSVKISKSLFNIPSLLAKSKCFSITGTIKLETKLLEIEGDYYSTYFDFKTSEGFSNYRLLWYKKDSLCIPLWIFKESEITWAMHDPIFVDLNRDDKIDLFITCGHEEYLETYILLNNIDSMKFSEDNYLLGYNKKDEYLTIVDIDEDKNPEILEVIEPKNEYNEDVVKILSCDWLEIPDTTIIMDLNTECARVFSIYNTLEIHADIDIPDYSYYYLLNLFDEVRIITFEGFKVKDITTSFEKHIKWRVNILERLKPFATLEGKKVLESLIEKYNLKINSQPD
jgi:hypothetical protein